MELSNFPFFEVEFTKEGDIFKPQQVSDLADFLATGQATDLIVISHGWNNDIESARGTYRDFFQGMRAALDSAPPAGIETRKLAVMGILWPSKKFADKELIPGGAASAASPITTELLVAQLEDLKGVFTEPDANSKLTKAKKLISKLEDDPAARRKFANLIRSLAPQTATNEEDASTKVFSLDGETLMERLSKPVLPGKPAAGHSSGGATGLHSTTGGAAGFFSFFTGWKSAAFNLLNYLTYYQMKERAGTVGSRGVNTVLRQLRPQFPALKIHLVGHSFGGRLVTAATASPAGQPTFAPDSLSLLQAAFSHYGFAEDYEGNLDGAFRQVVSGKLVKGPFLVTYTQNDQAVGVAYPLASLVAGQVASALGDKNDRFGGIGRNGAQKTPEALDEILQPTTGSYQFQPGKVHNLNADAFIKDHSDINGKEVMHAILNAIITT